MHRPVCAGTGIPPMQVPGPLPVDSIANERIRDSDILAAPPYCECTHVRLRAIALRQIALAFSERQSGSHGHETTVSASVNATQLWADGNGSALRDAAC